MRASVPVSVFPSLSLKLILWSMEATELIFLPGLLRPSQEGALCLHLLRRAPGAYVKQCKLCVNCFIGSLLKPRNISLFLSLSLSYQLRTTRFWSIKGFQHQCVNTEARLTTVFAFAFFSLLLCI